jgi:hypothetical protein
VIPEYEEVSALFHHRPCPAGLVAHLVELEGGACYAIRFYRNNYDKLTPMDRWAVSDWANETLGMMNVLVPTFVQIWQRPGVPA